MTAFWIVFCIFAIFTILAFTKIKIEVSYIQTLLLSVTVGFVKFKKEIEIGKSKDDGEETESKPQQKRKKTKPKKKQKEAETKSEKRPIKDTVLLIKKYFIDLFNKFRKYARLEKLRLETRVACDDAMKTAIAYGGVCAAVGALAAWGESIDNKKNNAVYTRVTPDFISQKSDIAAELVFSLRVWHIVSHGITGLKFYFDFKKKPKATVSNEANAAEKTENA